MQRFYPMRDPEDYDRVTLVPVSEEVYRSVYPGIWKTQKRMRRAGQCVCPKNQLWKCDGDCLVCTFYKRKDLSLNAPISTAEGIAFEETVASNEATPEEKVCEAALLEALYAALDLLDPEGKRICELMKEHSERETADILGMSRSTFKRRWERILRQLKESMEKK